MRLTLEEIICGELEKKSFGNTVDLKSAVLEKGFTQEELDREYESLSLIGVLKHGHDALNTQRYSVTEFGEEYIRSTLSFRSTQESLADLLTKVA